VQQFSVQVGRVEDLSVCYLDPRKPYPYQRLSLVPVHYTVSWDNRVGPDSDVHGNEARLWTTVRRVRHDAATVTPSNHVKLVIRTTGNHLGVVKNKVSSSWGTLVANNLITPHDGVFEEIVTFVQYKVLN